MERQFNIFSLFWTVLLHILVLLLLWLICFDIPRPQEESGVPVMLGNMGNPDTDYEFTEVISAPAPAAAAAPVTPAPVADPVITQNIEETVAIETGEKQQPAKPVETVHQPTPEEIRAEQERKAQEEASNLMAGAFGRSSDMQPAASATAEPVAGTPGVATGNAAEGRPAGVGNYGTFDLGGRGIDGGLPKPVYENINEEGRVVLTITVDSEGKVIGIQVNNRTNTADAQLRKAAADAAMKARFQPIDGVDNQTGTITYYFKLK